MADSNPEQSPTPFELVSVCMHCGASQSASGEHVSTLQERLKTAERLGGVLAESNQFFSRLITKFMESERIWRQVAEDLTEWGSDSCPNCGSEFIEGCEASHCAYYPLRVILHRIESASASDEGEAVDA